MLGFMYVSHCRKTVSPCWRLYQSYLVERQISLFKENRQVHVTDDRRGERIRDKYDGELCATIEYFRAQAEHENRRYETGHQ